MPKRSLSRALCVSLLISLLAPAASAQRRIIGGEPSEAPAEEEKAKEDDKPASPEEAEKKKKEAEAKKQKAEAERKKKEEEAEEKRRAKEAADEAARKAAEEAEEKKRLAEEAKKREVQEREKKRLEANKSGRLKAAKKMRLLTREDGKVVVGLALEPGAATKEKLMEVRFEVNERLDVADPRFGNKKPLANLVLVATVEEPAQSKGAGNSYRYVVQPLKAPGSYGLHHTPRLDGEHTVRVEGHSKDGKKQVSFSFPVHVGVWPPPDFDEEEAKNAAESAGRAAGSRRVIGSN